MMVCCCKVRTAAKIIPTTNRDLACVHDSPSQTDSRLHYHYTPLRNYVADRNRFLLVLSEMRMTKTNKLQLTMVY